MSAASLAALDRAPMARAGIAGAAFVAIAFVVTVALPLATYTTSLALFGLAHVLSELNYIDRRFRARLGGLALQIGAPIALAVAARAAAMAGVLPPPVDAAVELSAAAVLAAGAVLRMRRHRAVGAVIGVILGAGAIAAPFQMLLGLAILHNLTPLGFFAEALRGQQRRRALTLLAVPLIVLPLLIATGLPYAALARMGLEWPEARFLASGPLAFNLGVYVPASLVSSDWALHAFSAAVFAQIMHYAAVILLLRRLAAETPVRRSWRGLALGVAIAAGALALLFCVNYGLARQLYGLAALIHSCIEIPVLLLALGGIAVVQVKNA
ncbi:MAG TPA: hypothetical protein VN808_15810 [Stellaceae bacterium]|nr:hypothetical protein [Stellaceae bacterium]